MKIPKSVEIISQKINVTHRPNLITTSEAIGKAIFAENKIYIQQDTNTFKISKDAQEHAYYHELSHFILYYMGEMELCNNEKFVDLLGNILLQIDKTKKYA